MGQKWQREPDLGPFLDKFHQIVRYSVASVVLIWRILCVSREKYHLWGVVVKEILDFQWGWVK